ncbi:MAG: hypothetical protein NVSMB21_13480 [Vulcanimicrobiaceae bacterium]
MPSRTWLSPIDASPLEPDTPNSLADATTRWPVVDGIPYLRVGRDAVRVRALAALDAGDRTSALVALLADRGDWESGDPPSEAALRRLIDSVAVFSFRQAMDALAYGPVATEIAHRWSDPAYLAGLALLAAHRPPHGRALDIACGTGQTLRELTRLGVETSGADIVYSKLWLARHFVTPAAELVCFDVTQPWPLRDSAAHLISCNDAFHFFAEKAHVVAEMRRVAGPGGTLLVGHARTRGPENVAAGEPLDAELYRALLGARTVYDDRELMRALVEMRAPRASTLAGYETASAVSFVAGGGAGSARAVSADVTMPPPGTHVRRNPLYERADDGRYRIRWPSQRYETDYARLATYPSELREAPPEAIVGSGLHADDLVRRRAYVALPPRW